MNNIGIKIKEIYIPFLVISITTIILYCTFRWAFDIKLGVLPLKENLLNFWIPFSLPWIPILIWLRRRIRLLNVKGKRENGHFGYQFAMAFAIAIPIIVSQNYIQKASFDLVSIDNIEEITKYSNEKYFNVNSFSVNKKASNSYVTTRTSGRYNDNLTFHLYQSCPFENSVNIWYGVEYKKNLSNHISDTRKNFEYKSFLEKAEREFVTYNFQRVKYFEKLGYSDVRDGFIEAIQIRNPELNKADQIILVPESDDFEDRLGTSLPWIFGSFGIGCLVILLMVVIPKIDKKELIDFKKDKPLKDDDLKAILEFLDPRGPNKATAVLILLNIMVFMVMIFSGLNIVSPTPRELLEVGGNRRFEVIKGEYWRLITSIFIHGGLMHLLMNLIGLGIGASLLEGILGKTKLILSFIICGVFASLASIYWNENTVSVGASGAIFGLYGLILAFTIFKIYPNYLRRINWMLLGLYVGVSLLFGFLGGIDNAAHFGGLISGFILGGLLILTEKENLKNNISSNK
ncbi:rhomboid family intramembrane serine protease [Zhouia amylolytica]|uniref:rhomboid family intramembrane serine protease n=1 Tax=Zhouia amylolytica TaxID=376730 RepID=UPI0020CD15BE|nr:rhomboid family intramembrane serine protease [Zhouia amylolytica]MCQ0113050.1 rhomboid family intramembrane serine protease [Zhouia amylolytica]